jgi:hypothetical protein
MVTQSVGSDEISNTQVATGVLLVLGGVVALGIFITYLHRRNVSEGTRVATAFIGADLLSSML